MIGCAVLYGCDGGPTRPSYLGLNSLQITGPSEAVTGQTLHYTATARFSDGSSEDVTTRAVWFPPSTLTSSPVYFTSPGVALANGTGEQLVRATFTFPRGDQPDSRASELRVRILDPGTFVLTGTIAGSQGESIPGRVDVLEGIGAGRRAFGGRYTLLGVAGLVRLQASAEGWVPQVHEVLVTGNGVVHDFALDPLETPADVSGVWTMTLSPSAGCPAGLPDIARERAYELHLIQQGTRLQVAISSPTLQLQREDYASGGVRGARVQLDFSDLVDDFTGQVSPTFLDRLGPTETLSFAGRVIGSPTGLEIPATLAGTLSYWRGPVDPEPDWSCRADDHPVRLHDRRSVTDFGR
jgi:hypothetical protein